MQAVKAAGNRRLSVAHLSQSELELANAIQHRNTSHILIMVRQHSNPPLYLSSTRARLKRRRILAAPPDCDEAWSCAYTDCIWNIASSQSSRRSCSNGSTRIVQSFWAFSQRVWKIWKRPKIFFNRPI